jgi:tRNA A-37 threonylcarbamoyl transferase component Bud32/predicted nucleotidyltransferase
MSSISPHELKVIKKCISKVAKGREVVASCIYGSRVAGYNRPDSDTDLLVVLHNYPYVVKYIYFSESSTKVSALAVDCEALLRDAKSAFLGEFVVGRLLHIYEPIVNAEFFAMIERTYKRRVILEEVHNMVESTGVLSTEIIFPLEFVAFSKIKHRMSMYPNAAYSYYKTYTTSKHNVEFALEAYRRVLPDIIAEDKELFVARQDGLLQISEKCISLEKRRTRLKLTKRLHEFSSYFVHTYAGRKIMHFAVNEAESKIRRRAGQTMKLPDFMLCPRKAYWRLPEGRLIVDGRNWLDDLARQLGRYSLSKKRRLGSMDSRTVMYVLKRGSAEYKIAVKELARSKALKWAMLGLWTASVKRFRMDPLFRLGWEYKAIRYIRTLGLNTPVIEAVVLDRKLLVTRFLEGLTLADVITNCIRGKGGDANLISEAGAQIAKIHGAGATFGNIKPKNIIVSGKDLYFTDVEQFMFEDGDPAWDIAQFISWGVKGTRNNTLAAAIAREFLQGYISVGDTSNITRLAKSNWYIESLYPVLAPSIAQTIKKEIKAIAS